MTGAQEESASPVSAPRFAPSELRRWAENLLQRSGLSERSAALIADSLVTADSKGLQSHGLSRLSIYLERLRRGLIKPSATLQVESETASTLVLDAGDGFGHPAAAEAISRAVSKARETGICAVAVRNSSHFGTAGYFAELATRQGCIAMITTNSAARMAPWGAKDPMFGTNPLAIGIPGNPNPIILDMSTSAAALGKIILAQKAGATIPEGWALDANGKSTTDPSAALEGTLLPVGGPKGSGLALMLDILSGLLSGAQFGPRVGSLYRDFTRPEGCGHFMIVIAVSAFMDEGIFRQLVARYASEIKGSAPALPSQSVHLPGDLERQRELESERDGITFAVAVYADLMKLAEVEGVRFPAPLAP